MAGAWRRASGVGRQGHGRRQRGAHSTTVPVTWKNGNATDVCHDWTLYRIKLFIVSLSLVFEPAKASGKASVAAWCSLSAHDALAGVEARV